MPSEAAPLVDVSDIIRLVGPDAFQRGQGYARLGSVVETHWDADAEILTGTVRGTRPHPYQCSVLLASTPGGRVRPTSSICSCPMEVDCKHVAATLLVNNAAQVRRFDRVQVASGLAGGSSASVTDTPVGTPATGSPAWKTALSDLAGGPSTPRAAAHTPMALQFELREQLLRSRSRWNGPTARPAGAAVDQTATHRLGVRPVIRSKTGNWVRSNITWNSLAYLGNRLELEPGQQLWFAQFAALHRATRETFSGQEADWLYLDDFQSPLLWRLLDDARVIGIPLVGSKKDVSITVGTRADLSIDVRTDEAGDLRLASMLAIDGARHPVSAAATVGDHGIYAWAVAPWTFTLAPTERAIGRDQRRLLGQPELVVPRDDVDEFLHDFYPALRRRLEVTSVDDSVTLPELARPELLLTVTFAPKQTVRLEWAWRCDGARSALRAAAIDDEQAEIVERVERLTGGLTPNTTLQGLAAAEFAGTVLPAIEAIVGVTVETVGERPDYRELTDLPKLTVKTVETDKRDWFDLGVYVTVEGRDIPFTKLFKALSKGQKKLLLVDNSYLSLDQPIFDDLKLLIEEASALAEWETGLRISRYQASLWAEFEDLADETEQAATWREAAAGLLAVESVEATPLPGGVKATLRPYQQEGFNWLAFLWRHRLGGILADDMGLGKTLQALALMEHARGERQDIDSQNAPELRPFLVVAPTSVVSNWVTEAGRFTPGLAVQAVTATESKSRTSIAGIVAGPDGADVVVTSYALFRLDFEAYQAIDWGGLILDEAQFVKNHASKAHVCAVELRAPFKLAITGTPMENSLADLWSLFAIVAPGLFASGRRFDDEYLRPISGRPSGGAAGARFAVSVTEAEASALASERLARLRRRIRPLMMRRTKELVATELPAKQEQVLRIDLAPRHRKLYDTFLQKERQKLLGLIEDLDRNRFIVFRSLTLLRMLSLDASLVDEAYADIPSSKLDALLEQLDDVVAEGHRALIFSQFTSFLGRAAERLDAAGIRHEYLDGSTLHRPEVIARFKTGDAPVFLISLKAGGFGLNLTEADYVFLLDPWWNPATESQAVDRTHRIGQTRSVNVYRLVSTGTIEEKVMALRDRKAALFDAVMDDDAMFSTALTAEDIRGLLDG
ncbi:DEAD/DEAH box helicase [Lacisediminihabitans profunda]|uniref:DEAD/DEAH box helicase n=1 Tax=Lacisediminihabitans profunda TaxID=2594790 RepID=A0A5C8UVD0_9MICO|nr:DEAD/DEAH box helicase [Lacisediminihabitans profunda]TXN31959.1 DEAD/DEAH box helicase [Lacisediminihabitans profunda]